MTFEGKAIHHIVFQFNIYVEHANVVVTNGIKTTLGLIKSCLKWGYVQGLD